MTLTFKCPKCNIKNSLPRENIPAGGLTVTCSGCGYKWKLVTKKKEEKKERRIPLPEKGKDNKVRCPQCGHLFAVPSEPTGSPGRKKILIVDDQEYFRRVIIDTLGESYDFDVAVNVESALQKTAESSPDLMILDLPLESRNDGETILKRMEKKEFPILILTGEGEEEIYGEKWLKLERLGADGLLLKSLDMSENLTAKIKTLLEGERKDKG